MISCKGLWYQEIIDKNTYVAATGACAAFHLLDPLIAMFVDRTKANNSLLPTHAVVWLALVSNFFARSLVTLP